MREDEDGDELRLGGEGGSLYSLFGKSLKLFPLWIWISRLPLKLNIETGWKRVLVATIPAFPLNPSTFSRILGKSVYVNMRRSCNESLPRVIGRLILLLPYHTTACHR